MCGRFACGLSADVVRRLSTYMHSQTQELTEPEFIDLMPENRSFRPSWNLAPTSTWYSLTIDRQKKQRFFLVSV